MPSKFFIIFLIISLWSITFGYEPLTQCVTATVECICGTGESARHVQLKLEANTVEHLGNNEVKCSGYPEPHRACANISCNLTLKNSSGSAMDEKDFISNFYPRMFTFLAGNKHGGHRFARQEDSCRVTPLKNAHIKCWEWPKWMKCNIKCIHGYAFEMEGRSQMSKSITCRSSENKWKPFGFQECQPYISCRAQLIKPGNLECKQHIDGPAYCLISCHAFEEYEAVSLKKYECKDDRFSSILPHCVALNEYMHLLPKPR